jgi:hypothetical protein
MKTVYEVQIETKNGKSRVIVRTYPVERENAQSYYVRPFDCFLQALNKRDEGVNWTTSDAELPKLKARAAKEFVNARNKNVADIIKSTQRFIATCASEGIDVEGCKI